MQLWSVEHFLNISFTFVSSKLESPLIKTLERENLILVKKMLSKCSTDQRFIQKRNTTYKIGTLEKCLQYFVYCSARKYTIYYFFTLKMKSVSKNIIFGLKMMVKSGLEKFILKSVHVGRWLFLLLSMGLGALLCIPMYTILRENRLPNGGISKIFFRPLFTIIFKPKIIFLVTDPILRVKTM